MKALKIKTKRTILRLITTEDFESVAKLNGDPEVRKYFPGGVLTKEQSRARINELMSFYELHGLPCFVIRDKTSDAFIGRCGFGPVDAGEIEVGYLIAKKFWGQGYATEALLALLNWAKNNIKKDHIIAFAPIEHIASQRVMEKCGMTYYKEDIGHGVQCKFYQIINTL